MAYVRVDGETLTYPYSDADLRRDNPHVSFPAEIGDPLREQFGVYPVQPTERPTGGFDKVVVELPPALSDGVWWQSWSQTEADADTMARRRAMLSVTALQMRRALRATGLKDNVDTYLSSQSEETREAWEYATVIKRNDPLIAAARVALGKTDREIDDLFALALTIE